jgi:hypothetical protein
MEVLMSHASVYLLFKKNCTVHELRGGMPLIVLRDLLSLVTVVLVSCKYERHILLCLAKL